MPYTKDQRKKIDTIKEVAGDAAVYFNPKDIKEMRDSIFNVLSDNSLKKELIEAGRSQLKNYSWEKCQKETNLLYEKVV